MLTVVGHSCYLFPYKITLPANVV